MSTAKRPGLTRQSIVQAALRLLDEVGLDGLTVRRLAAELGVRSPALYWHIRTKQELLDEMAEAMILAAGMGPPREDESWQDWLARRARAYRRTLLAHRDGARIVAGAAQLSAATINQFDEELTALVARGFTPVLALRTITTISLYVNGFVLQEQTRAHEESPPEPDRSAGLAQLLNAGPASTLLAALRDGGGDPSESAFEHGLGVLIDGTAAAISE
ncbi:TetR/AcrR family transcriptional regulator C-terminal domain-containing protein [Actinomadura barringtoniae]|uniref:TetR/AcrR family transcriptional regulator C-terminal domain-containing protein n=1 Tax=Actinomadura barringtoniae TaxID=1427535 RepID=A0A939PKH2_9ACTN|nr:TetR/AcrR family transcriptional regulator C-terminal domain-containing protein [Actinomadura barringtoniae]MBO2450829.1 TetR/AcrR family transcriptional regulator C-terminal domain-containing protein [Actinomadura barringtoniae]